MPPKDSGPAAVASVAAKTTLLLGLVSSSTSPSGDVRRVPEWTQSAIASSGHSIRLVPVDVQSSAQTLRPIDPPAWLAEVEKHLAKLGHLPDRWGGSERPSQLAIHVARALVRSMERHGHRVLDIAPIADGGIAVYYLEDSDRHARFDVDNDGGILVATRAGREISTRYAELPEVEAVAALSRFLQYDDDATPAG